MVNRILFVVLYLIRNFLQSCFYYIHFPMPFILFSIYITCFLQNPYYISRFILLLYFFFFCTLLSYHWKVSFLELLLYYCNFFPEKFLQYLSSKLVLFFLPLPFFFLQLQFAIFFFRKFQCCFSYCSNFLFSKLSFNVTLPFLDIFSLIKCRFLCKIKFLWTWLKNWSLNRNLYYSSNTIMHTRKNTLNIFACRAILQIHLHTFAIFA